jgi:hypothetical protein
MSSMWCAALTVVLSCWQGQCPDDGHSRAEQHAQAVPAR